MDRRVWLDLGETVSDTRQLLSLTIVDIHSEGYHTYTVINGSVEMGTLDTLDCPGVKRLQDDTGEWNIEPLHPLAKMYLLRTFEPL